MNAKKLNYSIWGTLIATFVLLVAMVLVWKFKFYDQVSQKLKTSTEAYDAAALTAKDLDKNLKAALLAYQKLQLADSELEYLRIRYRSLPMDIAPDPTYGNGPRDATFRRYLVEYSSGFGLNARAQLVRAADESGVKIETDIEVDAPPQNPEDMKAPPSGFLKPETAPLDVEITGTTENILQFFQIINRSEILMVVGNVKLEGISPTVTASFTLTPYLLVTGKSKSEAPIAGAAATATGTAGATGGSPGSGDPRASGSSPSN